MSVLLVAAALAIPPWVAEIRVDNDRRTLTALDKDGAVMRRFEVGVGWKVHAGTVRVVVKAECPPYRDPATKRRIPGCAADNPLGARWLALGIRATSGREYGIHGQREDRTPDRLTRGCIRLRNADVIWLYEHARLGTLVRFSP